MTPIWLDIARLLERACLGALTGIDRVELAYAEGLPPGRTRFVALQRFPARLAGLPTRPVRAFLRDLREAWRAGRPGDCRAAAAALLALAAVSPAPAPAQSPVYLLVSHRHLHRPAALRAALRGAEATFVPMLHDVIPLAFPEYGRPQEAQRHRQRMATVAALADGVVTNSAATAAAAAPWLPSGLPVLAAPLGIGTPSPVPAPEQGERPYFLCVGTIEPRKNHLLLLHLWRRLAQTQAETPPRLVIVGGRGWENENVLDLLDRCPALRPHVRELGTVPDDRLGTLMAGARALLLPSFAEGFGLPAAEALAHGTPVLCSDLPALREACGAVPEYLDPLDAPAWTAAVLDYASPGSARRAAQVGRMKGWQAPRWDAHLATVVRFADSIAANRARSAPDAAWHGAAAPA
jgi:glycosyltransferase involved in cell wall biosynthesis